MKKLVWCLAALLLVTWSGVVVAGGSGKCSQDAQSCLNYFAAKKDKGWSGIETEKTDAGQLVVKKIAPGGPAVASGIQEGDVMLAINGAKLTDEEAVKKAKGEWKAGQTVKYTVVRLGAEKELSVTLGTMPEELFAAMVGRHMTSDHMNVAADVKPAETKEAKSASATATGNKTDK